MYMHVEGITGPILGKFFGWIKLDSITLYHAGDNAGLRPKVLITKHWDTSTAQLLNFSNAGKGRKVIFEKTSDDDAQLVIQHLELEDAQINYWHTDKMPGRPQSDVLESIELIGSRLESGLTVFHEWATLKKDK